MIIYWKKGRNGEDDRKFFIKQQEGREDGINIMDNCILANQLVINELKTKREQIDKYGNFLFSNALSDAVIMGCLGLDLWNDKVLLDAFTSRHCLSKYSIPEMIDPEDEDGSS